MRIGSGGNRFTAIGISKLCLTNFLYQRDREHCSALGSRFPCYFAFVSLLSQFYSLLFLKGHVR